MYENELKVKSDLYNQNISHLSKNYQEELRRVRIEYENKISEVIRQSEDAYYSLLRKSIKYRRS